MRAQQELLPQSVDEPNPPLSDTLKKIKDITQNIERIDFWPEELPSKTMDKILYAAKRIGKIFLDPSIAVSLIEFACYGYTKKEIRKSVALSAIDAVRNVLMAKKFGEMIVDKINVVKVVPTSQTIASIEKLYPNLKKYKYDIKYSVSIPFFSETYMWLLGKSYWTKKPINVFIRKVGKNVTIRVVDTNVLFSETSGIGNITAMDSRGEPVRFSEDVHELFFYALLELDIDDDKYRFMTTYSIGQSGQKHQNTVMLHIDLSYGSVANRNGERCGTKSLMTISNLIEASFLQQCLTEYRSIEAENAGSAEPMDNEGCVYGFEALTRKEVNGANSYTYFRITPMRLAYADSLSFETNDGKMVMDGVRYILEHGGHRGYAFVGKPGSGKTTLMNHIVQEFSDKANFVILRKDNLAAMNPYSVSELCARLGNVIIVVDDIDSVDFEAKNTNVDVLIRLFSDLNISDCNYVFICTANNASKLNKCLIGRADRIDEVVNFDGVTSEEAKKFFEYKFSGQDFKQSCERMFQQIQDEGMTYSDLGNIVQLVTIYFDGKVTCESLSFAIKRVVDTKKLSNNADTV